MSCHSVNMSLPVVKVFDESMMTEPKDYKLVWKYVYGQSSLTAWVPVAPQGYAALGCIMKFGKAEIKPPSGD